VNYPQGWNTRPRIDTGCVIEEALVMGADYY